MCCISCRLSSTTSRRPLVTGSSLTKLITYSSFITIIRDYFGEIVRRCFLIMINIVAAWFKIRDAKKYFTAVSQDTSRPFATKLFIVLSVLFMFIYVPAISLSITGDARQLIFCRLDLRGSSFATDLLNFRSDR